MTFPVVDTTYYITRLRGGGGVVVLFINQEESSTLIRMHLGPGGGAQTSQSGYCPPKYRGREEQSSISLWRSRCRCTQKNNWETNEEAGFPLLQPCARVCARAQIKYKTPKDAGARTVMICYISCFCLFFLQGPHPPGEYTHMCTSFFFFTENGSFPDTRQKFRLGCSRLLQHQLTCLLQLPNLVCRPSNNKFW